MCGLSCGPESRLRYRAFSRLRRCRLQVVALHTLALEEAMNTSSSGPANYAPLKSTISGDAFAPGDEGYDEARRAWELTADQRPAVVVFPESAADVVRAVQFASSQGMRALERAAYASDIPSTRDAS
jgi:hypothetical protein